MIIRRTEFNRILKILAICIDKSSTSGKDVVLFNERGMHASNGIVCVSYPFDVDFKGAVNGEKLQKLVSRFKQDEIKISSTEKGLLLRCGRNKSTLVWQDTDIEGIVESVNKDIPTQELPSDFNDAISLCNHKDMKNSMNGIFISGSSVCATDGIIFSSYDFDEEISEDGEITKMWVTQNNLNKVLGLSEKITHFSTNVTLENGQETKGMYVRFRTETDIILSCPLGDFSEIEEAVDELKELLNVKDEKVINGTLPSDFKEALDRVSQLGSIEEGITLVSLEFSKASITIKSESFMGNSNEELDWAESLGLDEPKTYNYSVGMLYSFVEKASSFTMRPIDVGDEVYYLLIFENEKFKHYISSL